MSESSAAIAVRSAMRRFGETVAVNGVSFTVKRGSIHALVGPDGAGKTTLLRLICGALAPDGGTVEVDGVDVVRETAKVQAAVGYMPAHFSLYPDLSVIENLRFYGEIFGVAAVPFEARSQRMLAEFALSKFIQRRADELSGGMKQKLALACALIHSPATVLLDEPTAGVDPLSRRAFWRILRGLNESGTTILVSTPYMDEAERAHRVEFMAGGSILSGGSPQELKDALQGAVLEIECARRNDAWRLLHGDPIVRSIDVFGDTLHVLVASAEKAVPVLEQILASNGVRDARVRRIEPSLEDAIVARLVA